MSSKAIWTAIGLLLALAVATTLWWPGVPAPAARAGSTRVGSASIAPRASAPASDASTASIAPAARRAIAASAADPDTRCSVEPRVPLEVRRASDDPDGDADSDAAAQPTVLRHTPAFLAARQRILGALGASADAYARAVAVWLEVAPDAAAGQRPLRLAAMARTTTDPRLYALAFRACHSSGSHEGCQALSVRRWAALDPGNAKPWLYALDDAVQAGDVSGQEEALFHLATASRIDDRYDTPVGPIVDAAGPDGAEPAAANALAIEAVGLSAAQPGNEFTLSRLCRASAAADANRRQSCLAAARVLADHADTTLARAVGVSLEAHLTGDPARLQRLRARPTDPAFLALDTPASCGQLRRNLQLWRRLAQVGEIGVLREHEAASADVPR